MNTPLKLKTLALCIVTGSLMTGCGGGGGGGGESPAEEPSASANTTTAAAPVTDTVQPPTVSGEAATTRELVVPQGFDLSQDFDIALSADARSFGANQAHLSVCTDFTQNDSGSYDVDYSSCVLKSALNPNLQTTLSVPGAVTSLIATVLPLDVSGAPTYRVWQRNDEAEQRWLIQ